MKNVILALGLGSALVFTGCDSYVTVDSILHVSAPVAEVVSAESVVGKLCGRIHYTILNKEKAVRTGENSFCHNVEIANSNISADIKVGSIINSSATDFQLTGLTDLSLEATVDLPQTSKSGVSQKGLFFEGKLESFKKTDAVNATVAIAFTFKREEAYFGYELIAKGCSVFSSSSYSAAYSYCIEHRIPPRIAKACYESGPNGSDALFCLQNYK